MRLLYVTTAMPFGSQEAFLIPEARELLRQGCELLIVPRSPERRLLNGDAAELLPHAIARRLFSAEVLWAATCEFFCKPSSCTRLLWGLLRSRNLLTLLKNVCVLPKALWLASILRSWKADHIHAHWATTTATLAWMASELSGIPWSMSIHGGDIVENNLLACKTESAQFVRVIAQSSLRLAEQKAGPVVRDKARLIRMGAALPDVSAPPPAVKPPFLLLCPASFLPVKGHRDLLEAAARVAHRRTDWILELAGEGPLRPELELLIERFGLTERVRFLGHVPHDKLLRRYALGEVHAVVLASLDLGGGLHEGIPVALMEAMSYSVPVIACATGGIPELLSDGAGVLIPQANAEALATAWTRLMTDEAFRQSLAETGQRRVREQFAATKTAAQLHACCAASVRSAAA